MFDLRKPFLTARWANLCLFNYEVEQERLLPFTPPGCELETSEGMAFLSLVAFDFLDTRVMGVSWPGYRDFPELNLRFYVRRGHRRGVCFVREFIPQRLPCWIARALYNEPYLAAELHRFTSRRADTEEFETRLRWADAAHVLRLTVGPERSMPGPASEEHFFKEHKWGYGRDHQGRTLEYKVLHPHWQVRPVLDYQVRFECGKVYGPEWTFLDHLEPRSVCFAVGSEVAVFPGRPL
ncbi:MAG: DUF2071 domain-containing protein [Candidatus Eremiobacteraeota bacterium]|nr:DUF2071 domain-containing protein [Candidatus Eremiobacteraeota bacterium]